MKSHHALLIFDVKDRLLSTLFVTMVLRCCKVRRPLSGPPPSEDTHLGVHTTQFVDSPLFQRLKEVAVKAQKEFLLDVHHRRIIV